MIAAGSSVAREIAASARHSYDVSFPVDVRVDLRVEQSGCDTTVRITGPDGREILQATDRLAPNDARAISFITTGEGTHRIEVSASRSSTAGRYTLSIGAPRSPTSVDRTLESARVELARAADLLRQGKYDDALTPAKASLELRESVLAPDDPLLAESLHVLGELYDNKGDYANTERMHQRALAIRERAFGPDHQQVARSLFNLGWVSLMRQDYVAAESMYDRALAIQERVFGPEHAEVATTLNDLAILFNKQGRYERSIQINERVLAIRERVFGPGDPAVALSLNNLGLDYVNVGDYARAEPCFTRALQIYEKTRPADHPDIAVTANNLAMAYEDRGDYAAAERLHLRAIAIDEKARGPNHPYVAAYVNNLALLYQLQGLYDKAGPLFERALAIRERALGPTHSDVGEALNNLANFYLLSGTGPRDEEIEALLRRSLSIISTALGPENHKVAAPLTTLARLYERRGEIDRAEEPYRRALAIRETALGPAHPSTVSVLGRLARLYGAAGNTPRAIEYWTRYVDAREQNLAHNLPIGSDRQKLTYVSLFNDDIDAVVSLHAQKAPHDAAALRLALTVVLQRKGRALDSIADSTERLRARAPVEERALLAWLAESRARLATLTLRGPDRTDPAVYRERLRQLSDAVEALEADLSARSAAFQSESAPITIDAVQSEIPSDAALVEFVRYRPAVGGADRPARYVAYLIGAGSAVDWIDLGDAASIDGLSERWRAALRDPARSDARRIARLLDDRIMRPVRAHLTASRLLVSPDGPLHVIPFAALVDEHGRYLVERYSIAYLTSGRDLLRLRFTRPAGGPPAVVADPMFGDPPLVTAVANNGAPSIDESQMFFGPLPGVTGEVRALRAMLPRATFLTRADATKTALLDLKAPELLHIATHGFFLDDVAPPPHAMAETTRMPKPGTRFDIANPLLRSGLALAGANQSAAGVLTALEAADLDLWGTRLVVLSACDTGVGELKNYEGVYGLRRALVLAGSESQLMTLWPVSDLGARDLVIGYYAALLRGEGRADALRDIQLKLLRDRSHSHPYYWASFMLSGQWRPLGDQP